MNNCKSALKWQGYTPQRFGDENNRWVLLVAHGPNRAAQLLLEPYWFPPDDELPTWEFVVALVKELEREIPYAMTRWDRYFFRIRRQLSPRQCRLLEQAEHFYTFNKHESRVYQGLQRRGLVTIACDKKSVWCTQLGVLVLKRLPKFATPKIEVFTDCARVTIEKDGKTAVVARWLPGVGLVDQRVTEDLDDDEWTKAFQMARAKCQ